MAEARVSEHLISLIEETMRNTWFAIDDMLTATARGTKPGDPLADYTFCLLLASALKEIH